VTRAAIDKGLGSAQQSRSGLVSGAAKKYSQGSRHLVDDGFFQKVVSYSLAINEVSACGGKIVAFPTAGSSGIVPGSIWAWVDTKARSDKRQALLREAFLGASICGALIAQRNDLAGAEGGCQAECGAASGMAACALAILEGLPVEDCFSAAALSLKNSLGLACDPVAGLVEVPCVKRNAFQAMNSVVAVELSLAGIKSTIPFDEVLTAMKQVGDLMSASLKETSAGGLAQTPTALKLVLP
jgi:L-serine dehydratase